MNDPQTFTGPLVVIIGVFKLAFIFIIAILNKTETSHPFFLSFPPIFHTQVNREENVYLNAVIGLFHKTCNRKDLNSPILPLYSLD